MDKPETGEKENLRKSGISNIERTLGSAISRRHKGRLLMPSDVDGPFLVAGYKGMILARTARKWEVAYRRRLPHIGLHGIDVFEEILSDFFPDVAASNMEDFAMKLRWGGFTIPFLTRMKKYFKYVAKVSGTADTVPLSMKVRAWAMYWLIECPKQHENNNNIPFLQNPAVTDVKSSTERSEKNIKTKKGKQGASSSSRSSSTQSFSASLLFSVSAANTPASNTSTKPRPTVDIDALRFLQMKPRSTLIWKGVSPIDHDRFQRNGMKWNLGMRRSSGDLSAAPAIYYRNNRRYAIAWGAYQIPPLSWKEEAINGAVVFEANLLPLPNNIYTANLKDTTRVQQWMTRNFDCTLPYDSQRTPPPGHTKADYDIITGPLRTVDVNAEHLLYDQLHLSEECLKRVRQVAFCTHNGVSYLNACHEKILVVHHNGREFPEEDADVEGCDQGAVWDVDVSGSSRR